MGEKVVAGAFDLSDRQKYRKKLHQCLEALSGPWRSGGSTGRATSWAWRSN